MTITFNDTYLPAASVNQAYSQYLTINGGTAPYQFALTAGSMPPGLSLTDQGLISGTATTLGLYPITITASDSTTPTAQTTVITYQLQVLDLINLLDSTVDQAQFVQQFENDLATSQTWSTGLTTQTSQTLIEFISAIGTFATSRIDRAVEDAFPETAQSDSAIRAITNMQGLRLSRKLPATAPSTLTSVETQTIPPFSQFSAGGYNWFNIEALNMTASVPITVTLREGQVISTSLAGLGSDLQTWVSIEDQFTVSDQDVVVRLNGTDLTKAFGALWNYPGVSAYADSTLSDGRLNIQFGSQGYGTVPGVNDVVAITYAVTHGSTINGTNLTGVAITGSSVSGISGSFAGNPSGGANEKSTIAYKNFAAGSFGTYSSAVTKAQYASTVANYPGVIDAIPQAQREINPAALKWMNVIRVSALTSSSWTQPQIDEFLKYMQSVTMYQPKFIWQTPVAILNDVDLTVYCFNSVNSLAAVEASVTQAITNLFSVRPGILMTDFFLSDLIETAMNAAPGQISYVVINKPSGPMIVTSPLSPRLIATVQDVTSGSITPGVYAYAIAVDAPAPNPNFVALIDCSSNPAVFPTAILAGQYWIVSKDGTIGPSHVAVTKGYQVLATAAGDTSFTLIAPGGAGDIIDYGTPTNWVNPQVTTSGSNILLDWSANPVVGVLTYNLWGRKPGAVGVIISVDADVLQYLDTGSITPTPLDPGAVSDTLIRYNTLNSLVVNAQYASRQSNALFPIRDSST
jgi:hypothetical protein